jgi:hypothetical protein
MTEPQSREHRQPPEGIEVKLVALADAANTSADGKLNLLGSFDILWATELPAVWPQMSFVAHLKISAGLGRKHQFQLRCVTEDGELHGPVLDIGVEMGGQTKVPGVALGLPLVLGIRNALFPTHGTYTFELWRGEEWVCATDLHVAQPPSGVST